MIKFDFWIGDEQRRKEVEVGGRGKWAVGGDQKMGPASHGGREERSPPSKDAWPGLQYLSLSNFKLVASVLTSHDIWGQVAVAEEGTNASYLPHG